MELYWRGWERFGKIYIVIAMQSIERFQEIYFKTIFWQYTIAVTMENFKGWQLLDFFGARFEPLSQWNKRSKENNKENFRLDVE